MRPASHLLWEVAGRPDCPKRVRPCPGGMCCVCGEPCDEGVTVKDHFGANFTDHNMLRDFSSGFVCIPCAWVMSGRGTQGFRLWSVICRTDRELPPSHEKADKLGTHIQLTTRGDLSAAVELLLEPPESEWVVTVSTSGQKHILPYAWTNRGRRWTVRLEGIDVVSDSDTFAHVLFHAASLRAFGFTAEEILSGKPSVHRITPESFPHWLKHTEALKTHRGGPILDLALICITKEKIDAYRDAAKEALERCGAGVALPRLPALYDEIREHRSHSPEGVVGAGEGRARDRSRGADMGRDGVGGSKTPVHRELHQGHLQLDLFA